ASNNLLGRVVTISDSAGQTTIGSYDSVGRALSTARQLRTVVDSEPDWARSVPLDRAIYTTTVAFDALGRPTTDTMPDGTTRTFSYLLSGPLATVQVTTADGRLTNETVL